VQAGNRPKPEKNEEIASKPARHGFGIAVQSILPSRSAFSLNAGSIQRQRNRDRNRRSGDAIGWHGWRSVCYMAAELASNAMTAFVWT
jgi:hypothetical protein